MATSDQKTLIDPEKCNIYSSKLKDIYLALPGYKYFHSPSGLSKEDERFVGRKKLIEKLYNIFTNSETKAGAYLITGYRGVGKTSLVRQVLAKVRREVVRNSFKEKALFNIVLFLFSLLFIFLINFELNYFFKFKQGVLWGLVLMTTGTFTIGALVKFLLEKLNDKKKVVIELSLAQSELNDLDILRLLTKNFYYEYEREQKAFECKRNFCQFIIRILIAFFAFNAILFTLKNDRTLSLILLSLPFDYNLSSSIIALVLAVLGYRYFHPILNNLGIITPQVILLQLRDLYEQVKANVTDEAGFNGTTTLIYQNIGFAKKRSKTYPQATARTIEAELISILRQIDELEPFYRKLEFYFVFDELDKIEVEGSRDRDATHEEQNNFGPEYSRKRQESIALLLGNLKHFLNVARAKFIFVASREMYDVFLADISDRDGYIGSVFHDVINVPSFYAESYSVTSTDIARLTEEYVCQFLIPNSFKLKEKNSSENLLLYRLYLENDLFKEAPISDWEKQVKIEKVIFTVRQFIIYLVYRSNGAPKSLTRLFESFIENPENKNIGDSRAKRWSSFSAIVCSKYLNSKKTNTRIYEDFYLHFDPLQQYKFGFTNYIFTQFLVARSKYMREFGDKMLVSAAYLLDHLYKFHNVAFSWHHLEQTPEMIDINKSPALRGFMEEIVKSLSNIHLREIVSGLYQFKFYKRIANEIDYISKISEMEAAAFNFTLDEHLQIKRYYQVKLKDFRSNLAEAYTGKSSGKSLYSLAELHMTLGDLHFYDQEFEEAKRHFTDAIRILKGQSPVETVNVHQFMLMIRNQLKLGLAHEKTQDFGAALAEYGNVSLDVASWRDLEFKNLGLVKALLRFDEIPNFIKYFKNYNILEVIKSQLILASQNDGGATNNIQSHLTGNYRSQFEEKKYIERYKIWKSKKGRGKGTQDYSTTFKQVEKWCHFENDISLKKYLYPLILLYRFFGKRKTMVFYGWPKEHDVNVGREEEKYYSLEEMKSFHSFSRSFMRTLESLPANTEKEKVYLKKTVFESFRLVYQPLIAKLHTIEKGSMGGVTYSDLKRNLKEFEYLSRAAWQDEKHLLESEYYNKVGNLLFYKNGYPFGQYDSKQSRLSYRKILLRNKLQDYSNSKDFRAPIGAYEYYRNSLEVLRQRVICYIQGEISFYEGEFSLKEELSMIKDFLDFLMIEKLKYPSIQNTLMESIGNSFSDFGNTVLSSIGKSNGDNDDQNIISENFMAILLGYKEHTLKDPKKKKDRLKDLSHYVLLEKTKISRLEIALLCFCISGMYFLRANRHRKYAFQNVKILYVLKDYYTNVINPFSKGIASNNLNLKSARESNILKRLLYKIERGLLSKVLGAVHRTNDNSARFEIEVYKQIFNNNSEVSDERFKAVLNSVSNTPEIREVLILFSELSLLTKGNKFELPNRFLLHSYSGISSQFTRVLELKYKVHVNGKYFDRVKNILTKDENNNLWESSLLKKEIDDDLKKYFTNIPKLTYQDSLFYLISDSIYCLNEAINVFKVYSESYMTSNSRLGFTHLSMAKWCERYKAMIQKVTLNSPNQANVLHLYLDRLLETNSRPSLNPTYHYEQAIKHFYAALQVHSEGDGYKRKLYTMYYLEDDFNDNLYHFGASIERYKINTGVVRDKIDFCKSRIKGSTGEGGVEDMLDIYSYQAYVGKTVSGMV